VFRYIQLPAYVLLAPVQALLCNPASADQVICDISRCSQTQWSAPGLPRLGANAENWARGEIWNYVEDIFARHGYIFNSEDLRRYFRERPWYAEKSKDVSLTAFESANVDFIKAREAGLGDSAAEDVIFPHSSDVLLARSEIERISPSQRRLARNEIFARHGYIFSDPNLSAHFGTMRWYRPLTKAVELTTVEQRNVNLIRSME
jgi:hypothetical protein